MGEPADAGSLCSETSWVAGLSKGPCEMVLGSVWRGFSVRSALQVVTWSVAEVITWQDHPLTGV